jgi:hypothetical protein
MCSGAADWAASPLSFHAPERKTEAD